MKVLLVGGNGFIGSNLILKLLEDGHKVKVYDRSDSRYLGRMAGVEYVQGELGNTGLMRSSLQDINLVYHLASTTIPETSNEDPAFDVVSNVADTIHMLDECVAAGVKRVVFISSGGAVYGIPQSTPISEDHSTEPICSYGITKLAIEKYLALFKRLYGLDYLVLRLSNPFGPYQNPQAKQGAVSVFMYKVLNKLPITIWGDGSVVRDYIYIEDAVEALLVALKKEGKERHIYNISSGRGMSLKEVMAHIEKITGIEARVEYTPARPLDVPVNILDNSLAKEYLGWQPKFSFEDGLKRTREWMLKV